MENEIEPIIAKDEMTALLGRSLTTLEDANFALYLTIARERIEGLLGGFLPAPLPADLKAVLAQAFSLVTAEQRSGQTTMGGGVVSSKRVEDFSISYDTNAGAIWDNFATQYRATLLRYQVRGEVRVSGRHDDCI